MKQMIALGSLLALSSTSFAMAAAALGYGTVQAENGKILRYRRTGSGYLLVLTPGQEILPSLAAFQRVMKFPFATATGIGNVSNVQLGQYNLQARAMDKSPIFPNAHEGFHVVGGHLITATIAVVGEIMITTEHMSPIAVKTHDSYFNGDAFDLNVLDRLPPDSEF